MFEYDPYPKFKAAAVQAGSIFKDAPQWFDVKATLEKATGLIEEASGNGARLIVFPELYLPGYPYWSLDFTEGTFGHIFSEYLRNSIEVPGPEIEALCGAAKKADAYVVVGINERDKKYQGRMYNSIVFISPRGEVMGCHRKLNITVQELFFHTQGQGGDNLKTVFQTELGNLGGSICGEHHQHMLMHNWIMQGLQVHCSLWPGFNDHPPTSSLKITMDVMTRALCLSGRVFAVLASIYIPEQDCPKNFSRNSVFNVPDQFFGGSGIINPYGVYVAGPVYGKETIVYGDVDLSLIARAKSSTNIVGIYSRWDIMNVNVRQQPYEPLIPMELTETNAEPCAEPDRIRILEEKVKKLEAVLSLSKKER